MLKLNRLAACFLSALGMAALAAGCGVLPSYQLKVSEPHKDVVHLTIYLAQKSGPGVYHGIAYRELARIQAEERRGVPLYEVNFEFRRLDGDRERLARVVFRLPEASDAGEMAQALPPRVETILY